MSYVVRFLDPFDPVHPLRYEFGNSHYPNGHPSREREGVSRPNNYKREDAHVRQEEVNRNNMKYFERMDEARKLDSARLLFVKSTLRKRII